MANKARGEVTLELGGETYVLVPSFGNVAEIEDKLGTSLFAAGRKLELADITVGDLLAYIQAFLDANGHALEPEAIKEAIASEGAFKVVSGLAEYCRAYAFGGQEKKEDADALKSEATKPIRETSSANT